MRNLVIFYSKTGKTSIVANTIKKDLKAHVKEIVDYTSERTVLDYMFTSLIDSASINPQKIDIDYYETIFIGTPVWFGSITPAIKKIIDNTDFKNKNIILFNTMKGIGGDIALRRMARLVEKHNGNVIGEVIESTHEALREFNLT